jgi:long-chain acyl-CoA synthetase
LKPGKTVTAEEIIDWAKKDLAKYKVPKQVEFRDELPKTTVGKILRRELIKQHKEKS